MCMCMIFYPSFCMYPELISMVNKPLTRLWCIHTLAGTFPSFLDRLWIMNKKDILFLYAYSHVYSCTYTNTGEVGACACSEYQAFPFLPLQKAWGQAKMPSSTRFWGNTSLARKLSKFFHLWAVSNLLLSTTSLFQCRNKYPSQWSVWVYACVLA